MKSALEEEGTGGVELEGVENCSEQSQKVEKGLKIALTSQKSAREGLHEEIRAIGGKRDLSRPSSSILVLLSEGVGRVVRGVVLDVASKASRTLEKSLQRP